MNKTFLRDKLVTKRLLNYAVDEKKSLFFGFLLTLIRTGLEILGPLLIGYILNHFIGHSMGREQFFSIAKFLAVYLMVYLLCGIFSNLSHISFEQVANKITFAIQKDCYEHVASLPVAYFDSLPAGNIVSRITNDTQRLKNMFQLFLSEIFTSSVVVVGLFVMIFVTNVLVALLLLLLAPVLYFIFMDFRYKTAKYTTINRRYVADVNAQLNENIQNMELIQSYCLEEEVERAFEQLNKNIFEVNLKLTKLRTYSGFRGVDALQYVATVFVLFYFGLGRITGKYDVSIGSLYIVIDYVSKIFTNLKSVVSNFGEFEQSYASASHVFDLFRLKVQDKLPDTLNSLEGRVEFSHVRFGYQEEDVIKDISFEVYPGQSVAFVGATGSGKSTIMNLLLHFYDVRSGKIFVDGQDIATINRRSLREDMAVVLQDAFLFDGTIEENIALGGEFSTEEVETALREVGGEDLVLRGIKEEILEKGSNLSAGEKQLICFARAYIRNPKILILDEATSNIDTQTEKMIQRGIEKLKENRTTFIIAHRLSTIRTVDCIYVLHKGKIIEQGRHDELMVQNGYYADMYVEQMQDME